jgi:MOSC domain-containing protein YiiM
VGSLRVVPHHDAFVETGIFKSPVAGPVRVGREALNGDMQADLRVHGGVQKAVYLYPGEHYVYWQHELPGVDLPWGSFGENLTTDGVLEHYVRAGDRLRIGTAEFVVTTPRKPCYKLGLRFGRSDVIHRFWASGRSGFYLAIATPGTIEAGDAITIAPRADPSAPTVFELFRESASRARE